MNKEQMGLLLEYIGLESAALTAQISGRLDMMSSCLEAKANIKEKLLATFDEVSDDNKK